MKNSNLSRFYSLLKNRSHYRRLVLGGMVSQLGDWLSYIALSYLAVRESGDQSGMGMGLSIAGIYLAHSLPHALAAPFVGPLVDRYHRRTLILISYLSASLLTLLIWTQVTSGSILVIQLILCLRVIASNLGTTARQASLPSLVKTDELYTANALNSSVWSTLFTLGVALGGVISALLGPKEAILIDAFSYLISGWLVWKLPKLSPQDQAGYYAEHEVGNEVWRNQADQKQNQEQPQEQKSTNNIEVTSALDQTHEESHKLSEAFSFARQKPQLWIPLLAKSSMGIFNSAGWIALNVTATVHGPKMSAVLIGIFTATRGMGMGIGPAMLKANQTVSPIPIQWSACLALALFVWVDYLWISLIALFIWGVSNGINWVSSTATLQHETPSHLLGRMTSIDFICFTTTQSLFTIGAGWLYDQGLSITKMYGIVALFGISGIVILYLLERKTRVL